MEYCICIDATATTTAVQQYLAPYFGACYAEYFRNRGMHALVVYDDLSRHAVA
jgi:F0F1-type ATP synthase alpha subunit